MRLLAPLRVGDRRNDIAEHIEQLRLLADPGGEVDRLVDDNLAVGADVGQLSRFGKDEDRAVRLRFAHDDAASEHVLDQPHVLRRQRLRRRIGAVEEKGGFVAGNALDEGASFLRRHHAGIGRVSDIGVAGAAIGGRCVLSWRKRRCPRRPATAGEKKRNGEHAHAPLHGQTRP
jgi:hypothetical protein